MAGVVKVRAGRFIKKEMLQYILHRLKGDKVIWGVIFGIAMISLLGVYTGAGSPVLAKAHSTEYYLLKHFVLLAFGFLIMFLVHRFDYRIFAKFSDIFLYLTIPVLVFTLLLGEEVNNAARWINIGGFSFQPSDMAKVALMIYLAKLLTKKQEVIRDFKQGFLPALFWITLICLLIAPADLSTASLLFVTSFCLLFVAGVDLKYLGGLVLIGIVALMLLFQVSGRAETWHNRWDDYVASWTDPDYEPQHQVLQAYGAMANGGPLGKGFGKSTQRSYLANGTSDMIYPLISEELGTFGAVLVLLLYLVLLFRTVGIVTMSKTFGALLAAGLAFLLVFQALANMAVAVGILPVTGLPLPMLSMGGTSILFTGFALGLILSVSRTVFDEKAKLKGAAA